MNTRVIGLISFIVYFVVSFSQIHVLIPGVKFLKLGLLSSVVLFFLVIPQMFKKDFYSPIGKYYLIFIFSIIPGMLLGYATGVSRHIFFYSLQSFLFGFIALCIFVNSSAKLELFNKIILLTTLSISLFVITNGGHGPGTLVDENDVGLVLTMLLPFVYFSLTRAEKSTYKISLVVLLLITILAVARTLSRGAMVGILPTLFIIWLKSRNKIVTLSLILIALTLTITFGPKQLLGEFESIRDTNAGTAGQRKYYWHLSTEMFKQTPLIGVGAGAWGNAVWSGMVTLTKGVKNTTPHSIYFQLISEMGILGAITWLLLIFTTFKTGFYLNRLTSSLLKNCSDSAELKDIQLITTFSKSLTIGLIGGLICGLFLSFLFEPYLYFYIGLTQTTLLIAKEIFLNQTSAKSLQSSR